MNKTNTMNEQRAVSLVLLGALFVRLYALGSESFWLDEAIVWDRIRGGPLKFFFDWDADTQGPIYPLLIWIWSKVFGFGEISLRVPSALFGVLSIHALYLLGKRLFGHTAAIWASVITAVNPFLLYYSQEARPYTLWLWASLLAVWYLFRFMERPSRVNEYGFIGLTLVSLYVHPYGPFLLAIFAAVIVVLHPRSEWSRFKKSAWTIGIAYLPEAYIFLDTFIGKVKNKWSVAAWIYRPDLTTPWLYMKYYFSWDVLAAFISVLLIGGMIVFYRRIRESREGFVVCWAIIGGLFGLPWLVSQVTPILWMRYTIIVVAPVTLLAGWSIAQLKRPLQFAAVGLFLMASVYPLYHYYSGTDKDPWREAVTWLSPRIAPQDRIIVHPLRAPIPFEYYYRDLFDHEIVIPQDTAKVAETIPDSGTVWFVTATYSHSKPMREKIYSVLNESCDCDATYKTADLYPRNPFLLFRADVEITRCVVRQDSAQRTQR